MPSDAPAVKRAATEEYGAQIVLYDRDREDREAIGLQLAAQRGLAVIPPYDHAEIIAGTGTVARELIEEIGPLDLILVPCGGGGLLTAPLGDGLRFSLKSLGNRSGRERTGRKGTRRRLGQRGLEVRTAATAVRQLLDVSASALKPATVSEN